MKTWVKVALGALLIAVGAFVLIQFLPVGTPILSQKGPNPFKWSDPQAEAIAKRACYDCHSTDPHMWWLVYLAPFKWMAGSDAQHGTDALNFSNWTTDLTPTVIANSVDSGRMPPWDFWVVHWNAILSSSEKATLVAGYKKSLPSNQSKPVPADAMTVINARCGWCHSKGLATGFRAANDSQAQAMVTSMVKYGAIVTPAERETLVHYYTSAYRP